jgi:hypothetical protein
MSLQDLGIPKKCMTNPSLMIGGHFKDYSGILFMPFELSMPCRQTIFQLQCIQSIEPGIPGNPRSALNSKSLAVSLALGALKYVEPKTCTIATAKRLTHIIEVVIN